MGKEPVKGSDYAENERKAVNGGQSSEGERRGWAQKRRQKKGQRGPERTPHPPKQETEQQIRLCIGGGASVGGPHT